MILLLSLFCGLISLCSGDCKIHTTILRQLRKQGFHLELLSTVEIIVGSENCPDWKDCTLSTVETIGSSFYTSSEELSNLHLNACIPAFIDVEQPQSQSTPHTVYFYSQPSRLLNLVHSDLKLPLHLRYHSPRKGGGYVLTVIHRPSLLLQCRQNLSSLAVAQVRAPCPSCSIKSCDWIQLPYKTNAENLTVAVPVGDLDHLFLVTAVTYLLAFGGAVYLSATILQLVTTK